MKAGNASHGSNPYSPNGISIETSNAQVVVDGPGTENHVCRCVRTEAHGTLESSILLFQLFHALQGNLMILLLHPKGYDTFKVIG
jgi:hypothetical protein